MFELSVAFKYLLPRWRQLSVSIISLISVLVIALVVWLILVFFSVTNGLIDQWTDKLISLTAPVRITPTDAYYHSFYYLSDSLSEEADYTLKTLAEKRVSPFNYNPEFDAEAPSNWGEVDLDEKGQVKDLVNLAFEKIQEHPSLNPRDYEMTMGNLNLQMLNGSGLSQTTYLGSFDPTNYAMSSTTLSPTPEDLSYLLHVIAPYPEKVKHLFSHIEVKKLKTPDQGWALPRNFLPNIGTFAVHVSERDEQVFRILIPKDEKLANATLTIRNGEPYLKGVFLAEHIPLIVEGGVPIDAKMKGDKTHFQVKFSLQGKALSGTVPYTGLDIAEANIKPVSQREPLLFAYQLKYPDDSKEFILPKDPELGEGILLPKTFKEAKVHLGDRGYLSYYSPTTSSVQEMRLPVFVAGFYDPGIIPIGGKYVITSQEITSLLRISHNHDDTILTNGINVRFEKRELADQVKETLQASFDEAGIAPYWKIETYREYNFTKDIIQQLRSEKNMFTLIATVIIIVACSNIISMLIILVNDKKLEIGILRSMGASSMSIATIFGLCGVFMGLVGSLLGAIFAIFTLYNIQSLIGLISWFQGHEMLNPVFYGDVIPNQMSAEALSFVLLATVLISLIAGIVPAVKASMMRPSNSLRAS